MHTMDLDTFWQAIEETRPPDNDTHQHAAILIERLVTLEPVEIMSFEENYVTVHREAYRCDLWSAIYEVAGGCGDDGFMDFRAWLIAQGRDVFETVLADPQYLGEIGLTRFMSCEPFGYVAMKAYETRTGRVLLYDLPEKEHRRRLRPRGRFIRTDSGFRRRFPMLW